MRAADRAACLTVEGFSSLQRGWQKRQHGRRRAKGKSGEALRSPAPGTRWASACPLGASLHAPANANARRVIEIRLASPGYCDRGSGGAATPYPSCSASASAALPQTPVTICSCLGTRGWPGSVFSFCFFFGFFGFGFRSFRRRDRMRRLSFELPASGSRFPSLSLGRFASFAFLLLLFSFRLALLPQAGRRARRCRRHYRSGHRHGLCAPTAPREQEGASDHDQSPATASPHGGSPYRRRWGGSSGSASASASAARSASSYPVTICSCPAAVILTRSSPSAKTSTLPCAVSIHRNGAAAPLSQGSGLRSGMA